jgi:hypothetical protein
MWLRGERKPKAHNVIKLAAVLGVDEDVAMIASGNKSPDPYLDPNSATARLSPLIEQVDWESRPGRLDEMEAELRFMVDVDRKKRQLAKDRAQ